MTTPSTPQNLRHFFSRRHPTNLPCADVDHLSWSPTDVPKSLEAVRNFAEQQAHDAIDWYYRKKGAKAFISRLMRILAIALATVGGLIPIVGNLPGVAARWQLEKWGYVALGVAAACIALDKFFGSSTGWVRYITTAQNIQDDLYTFQLDWARSMSRLGGTAPTASQIDEFLQLAKSFIGSVMEAVTHETQQWVAEFQNNMAELERATKVQLESARPGSLTVTVDNADASDQPIRVDVDGVAYGTMMGKSWAIRQISPGTHTVAVSGRKGPDQLQSAGAVVVPAGGSAQLDLKIA